MIKFHILSAVPQLFGDYFNHSIIGRAYKKGIVDIKIYDLHQWSSDKHHKIDDSPYGGGPGMVLKVQPIFDAVEFIKSKIKEKNKRYSVRTILFSTRGKLFNSKEAKRLSKYKNLILICGRYEGVDQRVAKYIADEEISIGDFVLSGGEIPAMIVVDAVSRFVPGVLGKKESLEEIKGSYPVYTRPEVFVAYQKSSSKKSKKIWKVPLVLLSGDHKKIEEWRKKYSK
jgi:tRNA (guanine37-N1)-methyltransferase